MSQKTYFLTWVEDNIKHTMAINNYYDQLETEDIVEIARIIQRRRKQPVDVVTEESFTRIVATVIS